MRSQVLTLKERMHIYAARTFGADQRHILKNHIVPDISPIIASMMIQDARRAVFMEAGLAFLGVSDPLIISWGKMMNQALAFTYLDVWKWWLLPTGILLSLTLVSLSFLGVSLEAAMDPRLCRHEHEHGHEHVHETEQHENEEVSFLEAGLRVTMAKTEILRGIDLDIDKGDCLAIIGESGAGKSTLGLSIMGLLSKGAARGEVLLNGRDLFRITEDELRQLRGGEMAMVFQNIEDALDPVQQVGDQIIEAISIHQKGLQCLLELGSLGRLKGRREMKGGEESIF